MLSRTYAKYTEVESFESEVKVCNAEGTRKFNGQNTICRLYANS